MCYRTKLNAKIYELERAFEANFIEPDAYIPAEEINGFRYKRTPVITDQNWGGELKCSIGDSSPSGLKMRKSKNDS